MSEIKSDDKFEKFKDSMNKVGLDSDEIDDIYSVNIIRKMFSKYISSFFPIHFKLIEESYFEHFRHYTLEDYMNSMMMFISVFDTTSPLKKYASDFRNKLLGIYWDLEYLPDFLFNDIFKPIPTLSFQDLPKFYEKLMKYFNKYKDINMDKIYKSAFILTNSFDFEENDYSFELENIQDNLEKSSEKIERCSTCNKIIKDCVPLVKTKYENGKLIGIIGCFCSDKCELN